MTPPHQPGRTCRFPALPPFHAYPLPTHALLLPIHAPCMPFHRPPRPPTGPTSPFPRSRSPLSAKPLPSQAALHPVWFLGHTQPSRTACQTVPLSLFSARPFPRSPSHVFPPGIAPRPHTAEPALPATPSRSSPSPLSLSPVHSRPSSAPSIAPLPSTPPALPLFREVHPTPLSLPALPPRPALSHEALSRPGRLSTRPRLSTTHRRARTGRHPGPLSLPLSTHALLPPIHALFTAALPANWSPLSLSPKPIPRQAALPARLRPATTTPSRTAHLAWPPVPAPPSPRSAQPSAAQPPPPSLYPKGTNPMINSHPVAPPAPCCNGHLAVSEHASHRAATRISPCWNVHLVVPRRWTRGAGMVDTSMTTPPASGVHP